ncbi:MAG: alpha amylase C-terminal domain-containing protein [Clostridia bacterium]|nr:alpha amylase C-terminal domain-containing protein [Clostridia bacterium]
MKILSYDPYLQPYEEKLEERLQAFERKKHTLLGKGRSLAAFANGHLYFGFHRTREGWVYREWAPGADALFLTGDFCGWDTTAHPMEKGENGVFTLHLKGRGALKPGERVQTIVSHKGRLLRRIPLYATRVVQDPETLLWCAQIEDPTPYPWTDKDFTPPEKPLIYECHVGMAQEEGRVGGYSEFCDRILPRIQRAGYNTLQIMAIMEHPYYGSFGYQVSNFFAASSRYGTSRELKRLIDTAHSMGIAVLLDLVHSHAVKNTAEGLNEFDGTSHQFFHEGERGEHSAWGTKLFDYGKPEMLHFLLSNLKFWMEEYHFDGFRFDGVTSMLYHNHGLGTVFSSYDMYFSSNTDTDAVVYLQLANELIHRLNPRAVTVAEDMSGMPGMCLPIRDGGLGFDYRLSMGVPDLWIRLIKEKRDEDWSMGEIWFELTRSRPMEKSIAYTESHDQALVGDKTILFRLCDAEMYTHMAKSTESLVIDRGIALHKMLRLLTATLAGDGYLNFMGNEFGHPEWIDFPREGNGWSYHYCRRQWSLADDPNLRYGQLLEFDREMIALLKEVDRQKATLIHLHEDNKLLFYAKGDRIFLFNLHPSQSFESYPVPAEEGRYEPILSTDSERFGGFGRVDEHYVYNAGQAGFRIYLPARCALVLQKKR